MFRRLRWAPLLLFAVPLAARAAGSSNVNADRIYYGGFAVSLTDWVGPYRPRE